MAAAILEFRNLETLEVAKLKTVKCVTEPNFESVGQTVAEIWRFFDFLRWPSPLSWIFKRWEFQGWERLRESKCVILPNFAAIGQSVAKIWPFFQFFKMAAAAILDFQKMGISFQGWEGSIQLKCVTEPNFESIGQIVAEIRRFFDFSKMAAVRHLGFVMNVFGPPTKGI